MKVTFLHPDLGIGGAERLIIDAALALKSKGHHVKILTTYHNKNHCFPETTNGTLDVEVSGMWIPRSVFGRLIALLAYLKMVWATIFLVACSDKADIVIIDQISASIPIIKWFTNSKVLFYCHFPDMLLTDRKSFLKAIYRKPIDFVEEKTTAMADKHLVNSEFTKQVFRDTFLSISSSPEVLYPSINLAAFDREVSVNLGDVVEDFKVGNKIFLSINRYERKKNLSLALKAFAQFLRNLNSGDLQNYRLIMAGGYDDRVDENVSYYSELSSLASELNISSRVTFLKSPSEAVKLALLKSASALLYTPDKEHFGIVPLEAMYSGVPVIAVNSGGPKESIEHGVTGFLVSQDEEAFSGAMRQIVSDSELRLRIGRAGRKRVLDLFSFETFANNLNRIVSSLENSS